MQRIALRVDVDMRWPAEPKLLLYDRSTSGNSYKARLLLSFLNIPYEKVDIPLDSGRNKIDVAYLALNPRGQIPTLVHGQVVLWGSTAILAYLAFQFDHTKMWLPEQPAAIGRVMQWLELAQMEVTSGLFRARAIRRFKYSGDLEQASRDGTKGLEVLDQQLKGRDWLAAAHPTIADIACFPYAALASEGGFDLSDYRGVCEWIGRFKRLPRFMVMPGIDLPDLSEQGHPSRKLEHKAAWPLCGRCRKECPRNRPALTVDRATLIVATGGSFASIESS